MVEDNHKLVLTGISGPTGILTLNRPEGHNSLIPDLLYEILAAMNHFSAQPQLRALVLRARGPSFSSGGDLRAFAAHLDHIQDYAMEIVGLLNDVILTFIRSPLPIITAVQGLVSGGSLGLVLASDVVLLAPEVIFQPYYTEVGFSPDGGWTALLPQLIGQKRAAEIQLLNLPIPAGQAVAWGLANRLVPADRLEQEALALAQNIALMNPGSVHNSKHLLWGDDEGIAARLEAERHHFVQQIGTASAQDGMVAFLKGLRTP